MILKRLFRASWRKDDAAAPSATTAPISQELLTQRLQDPDPSVRRKACKQITDFGILQRLAETDPDSEVQTTAVNRLCGLLAGDKITKLPLTERVAFCDNYLDGTARAHLPAQLLHRSQEPELRLAVLPKIVDPVVLTECILQDTVAAVRLAAVERLEDKASLEQVVRGIGKKDKGVYRIARQKLKAIVEQEQAPLRLREAAAALCTKMERFARRNLWTQDKPLIDSYIQQWAALDGTPPDDLMARFQAANEIFQQGYNAYQAECQARLEAEAAHARLHAARHALLAELEAFINTGETDHLVIVERLADMEQRWTALDQEAPAPSQLQASYTSLMQKLREQAERLQAVLESCQRLSSQLEQGQQWLAQSAALDAQRLREWHETGDALAANCTDEGAVQSYRELREQLQQRLEQQKTQATERLEQLPARLDTLEQELETGVLRRASGLYQRIQADLALIRGSGLGRRRYEALEQRVHRLTPKLRELQSWRKWGTHQHRLEMCETLEKLAADEETLALSLLTERVQSLQAEWKRLDRDGIRASEALWQRFHKAADQVYTRCRPYLEEQRQLRDLHRQARDSLCQQVEDFLTNVNWDHLDWKKAVRAVREVRTTWESLGPVDPKSHKALNQRYRAAMKQLNRPLAQERARSRTFRQGLITQAQELATHQDVSKAIQGIRRLQEQWHITVATTRSQEDALWQAFRSACDQVFERRREAQQLKHEVVGTQIELLNATCEALEILAKAPGSQNLTAQFAELKAKWEVGLELGLPRQEEKRLQKRWQRGLDAMHRRVHLLEDAAQRSQMERLRAQATLCSELEALATQVGKSAVVPLADAMVADWLTRWDSLPKNKDPAWYEALEQRFNAALVAAKDTKAQAAFNAKRVANGRQRSQLCLKLEILSGVESPPEAHQERLAFQVSRLSGHLSQGVADTLDEAPDLEWSWYACGPAPTEQIEFLEQRFERVRRALSMQTRDTEGRSG